MLYDAPQRSMKIWCVFHLNYNTGKTNKQKHLSILKIILLPSGIAYIQLISQFNIPGFWFHEFALPEYTFAFLHSVIYTANLRFHPELHHFLREWKGLKKKEQTHGREMNACTMLGLSDKLWVWWCKCCTCVPYLKDKQCLVVVFRV